MGEFGVDQRAVEAVRQMAGFTPGEIVADDNGRVDYGPESVVDEGASNIINTDPAQFRPYKIIAGVHTLYVHYHTDKQWRMKDYPEEAKGHHDWEAGILEVRLTGCSEQLLRETLLHEIVHMIFAMSGLNKHWPGSTSEDPEEVVVEFASTALLQVMQANPALVSYLMDSSV